MVPALRPSTVQTASRLLGVLATVSAVVAAASLLFPAPLADVFFAAWVLGSVTLAVVGAAAAWTNRTPLLWAVALALTGLSIVGMWSIGFFVAPAALCLLGAAILLQWAGPRRGVRETIVANPPTVPEAIWKTLAGAGSLVGGVVLVYVGAFTGELFGACARETVGCVVATTHWGAVGTTVLGAVAVVFGGWLLWKQVYVARVLASDHAG